MSALEIARESSITQFAGNGDPSARALKNGSRLSTGQDHSDNAVHSNPRSHFQRSWELDVGLAPGRFGALARQIHKRFPAIGCARPKRPSKCICRRANEFHQPCVWKHLPSLL